MMQFNNNGYNNCESEKPQPKFNKGQWVRITNKKHPHYGHKGKVGEVFSYDPKYDRYRINGIPSVWEPGDLEPYTEPETKPTEDMETKELNLCELLQGHEGESIFLTTMGEVLVEKVSEEHLCFRLRATEPGWRLNVNGKMSENGVVITYPSRALYEQYPLDPYAAWMEWQEEQKKFGLDIKIETYFERNYGWEDCDDDVSCLHFRTPAERDKCIEEIKAIIEKYNK